MSSLYLHIPFCKQACHYCDFHFSTKLDRRKEMVEAIGKELAMQSGFFGGGAPLETLYFGGGTPSLLSGRELAFLIEKADSLFGLADGAEITLEANPDDLNPAKVKELKSLGINRLSIGIQSFHGPHLQWMNRAHNAQEAESCVKTAQDSGIGNITIDLIYGIPAETDEIWREDIRKALALGVKHLSAYSLTIEPKTAFGNWVGKGRMRPLEDAWALGHFKILMAEMRQAGFEHYEISNFAQKGFYSRHNSNYWKKGKYLGVGPSAHSYDGEKRFFNVYNNAKYVKTLQEGRIPQETEILSRLDHINEYLMTALRTQWGCDTLYLKEKHGFDLWESCGDEIKSFEKEGYLLVRDKRILSLADKGKFIADTITESLFQV